MKEINKIALKAIIKGDKEGNGKETLEYVSSKLRKGVKMDVLLINSITKMMKMIKIG